MSFVTKISKEGYDVRDASNNNLQYNSALASHSIFNIISVSLTSGATSLTVTHNLGYAPKVWIFMVGSDVDGTYMRRIPYLDDTTFLLDYYMTSTTVVIESDGGQSSTINFKIIIFTRSPEA